MVAAFCKTLLAPGVLDQSILQNILEIVLGESIPATLCWPLQELPYPVQAS